MWWSFAKKLFDVVNPVGKLLLQVGLTIPLEKEVYELIQGCVWVAFEPMLPVARVTFLVRTGDGLDL
jgi:hypothetical protein